jgi:GWxTD domain-containing protein
MKSFAIAVLALCLPSLLPAQRAGTARASLDLAAFQYDNTASFVELYYAFPRAGLVVTQTAAGFSASALLHASVTAEGSDREPVLKTWRVPMEFADTTSATDRTMIGRVSYLLAPGRYRIMLVIRDEARPQIADTVSTRFEVRALAGKTTQFSDIQLATSIRPAKEDPANIFYKNTLEVVPNPSLVYGGPLSTVGYYAELYNPDPGAYKLKTELVSSFGKTMETRTRGAAGKHSSRVIADSISVARLPTGVYTLILACGDTSGVMKISTSKRFFVYNPEVALDTAAMRGVAEQIAWQFASLSESELNDRFAEATYVALKEELQIWKSLSGSEAKKKFLTKFWRERDSDPATQVNEYFEEYQQRILACNERFRTPYRAGWKTDRGRVYVMYGPPDYVERYASESDIKPYEVWRYDYIEGGVEFYFLDRGGFNDLQLVHSTKRGEIYDPNWQNLAH